MQERKEGFHESRAGAYDWLSLKPLGQYGGLNVTTLKTMCFASHFWQKID